MDSFIEKFGGSISSTLECFDRVIFKGHLPFQNEARLNGFVDHVLNIRRKDFSHSWNGIPTISSPTANGWPRPPGGPTSTSKAFSARRPGWTASSVATG